MPNARWYVVKTKARQERLAEENLIRQGYNAWLPQLLCERHCRGKWQPNSEPMFPGYLFVELEVGVQDFSVIRSTRGVLNLVKFAHKPTPMPDGAVESLQRAVNRPGSRPIQTTLRLGQRVRVNEGPFVGWEGVYSVRRSEERVMIMLDVLGGTHALEIERNSVLPA